MRASFRSSCRYWHYIFPHFCSYFPQRDKFSHFCFGSHRHDTFPNFFVFHIHDTFPHFSLSCFQVCKTLQFKRFLFNQTQPLPVRVHNQILPRVYTIYTSTDHLIVLTTNWTRPAKQLDLKSTLKQYRQVFKEKPMWKVWQSTIRRLPFLTLPRSR